MPIPRHSAPNLALAAGKRCRVVIAAQEVANKDMQVQLARIIPSAKADNLILNAEVEVMKRHCALYAESVRGRRKDRSQPQLPGSAGKALPWWTPAIPISPPWLP